MRFLHCSAAICLALFCTARSVAADPVTAVIDLVGRDDADFRAIGLDRIRHAVKGEAATRQFADLLAKQPPERQRELLLALADRGDRAAIPAITAALAAAKDPAVRAAAVAALGAVGGGAEVAVLKPSLVTGDPERAAAKRALVMLRGDGAADSLIELAQSGEPAVRPLAIDILAERRARTALPAFVAALADADAAVRGAAMRALGLLGGPEQVPGMVQGFLKAAAGAERDEAEKAVVAVCTENPGKERAAESFLALFEAAGEADRETLLAPLGRIGGAAARAIVDRLIADPTKRELGLKALTRWPDATVADRLLDLFGKTQDQAERDMLLAALIRIAPLRDNKLNEKQKMELIAKIMPLCEKDADRGRLIERTSSVHTVEAFRFVLPYVDQPALAESACKSVVELAHDRGLRDANKDDFTKALDKVIATTKNPELVERSNRYKEGKTWERK